MTPAFSLSPISTFAFLSFCATFTACGKAPLAVEPGVSLELAEHRAAILSDVNYKLAFAIPESLEDDIEGSVSIEFQLDDASEDLQLDFREKANNLHGIVSNGDTVAVDFRDEHVVLPSSVLRSGANRVEIDFTAGAGSLNRNPAYLYTLFVPDRARTAFPLFDQPDLKATFELTLDLPEGWTAMSNAPVASMDSASNTVRFERSDRISSYLFSFVAGEFETVARDVDGRQMTMLHRETDREKVERNIDRIFELHAASLDWLEDYTGIEYPYRKFGFVLIPAFQYGGMEHVGAILYRSASLFLEEAPSDTELLGRASLIAHETAHMWFGNLVTMRWFNDVWTKEVFANFMAAKIVNPGFPHIDHDLNFLVRHYPRAYSVDRTAGANPIRQRLPNLNQAGQMYGAIIYNKAPIMMRELERTIGEAAFRDGMQEYLAAYSFDNATWPQLIEILDAKTEDDLAAWSDGWVNEPGRPEYEARDGAMTYGLIPVAADELGRWDTLDALERASLLIDVYENLLEGRTLAPDDYLDRLLEFAAQESNELVLDLLIDQLRDTYWRLLDSETRSARARLVETVLWDSMLARSAASERKTLFKAFVDIALTDDALTKAKDVWAGGFELDDLPLGEDDRIDIAEELAVKLPGEAEAILDMQLARTENPDSRRKLEFVRPSLSASQDVRDGFFASLKDPANRESEEWVLAALGSLHHPTRLEASERYLQPSLELLEEIQVTGDIFFPKRWLDATLGNYRSDAAAATVRSFLDARPNYNEQLRMKILQSADPLFRATEMGGTLEHAAASQILIVANRSSHDVAFVDVAAGEVVRRLPTGEGPHLLSNVSDGRVLATGYGEFPEPHEEPVTRRPPFVESLNARLTVIDTDNRTVLLDHVIDGCTKPHASLIVGDEAFVTCETEQLVRRLDIHSGRTIGSYDTGQEGSHVLGFAPELRLLAASNTGSGSVTLIDIDSGETDIVSLGNGSEGLMVDDDDDYDDDRLWVGNAGEGSVSVLNLKSRSVAEKIESVCSFPIAFGKIQRTVWVACFGSSELVSIDTDTLTVGRRVDLAGQPLNLLLHPAQPLAYLSLPRDNAVAEVDLRSGEELRRFGVGIEPDGLRWAH